MAATFAQTLRSELKKITILGPGEPIVSKIRNEFLMTILMKIPRDGGRLSEIKHRLTASAENMVADKAYRAVKIVFDVDPM